MNEQFSYVLSDQIEVIEKFNPRKEENYDVENLYESIKQQSILTPLLVMESGKTLEDGRPVYKLFEGHRRFKTLCMVEEDGQKRQIPVRIFEKTSEDELLMKALMLGVTGKQLKPSEKARAIAKLHNFGYDTMKIASMMRITQGNVSTLKKFEKLPISIQQKIDNELISFSETLKLMEQVGSAKTLEKIIDQAIQEKGGKVTSKDIVALVTNTDDEEIKNVQTNITNNIKAKDIVDDEDEFPSVKPIKKLANPDYPAEGTLSDDEVKKFMGIKDKDPKQPKGSLYKLYEYLIDNQVVMVLKPNAEKVRLLKAMIDYQHGVISREDVCDFFIDDND